MSVPNTFASATSAIPLANLDADFAYYDAAFQIAAGVMEVNYTFRLEDTSDNTKKAEFVLSGITTGTTRQYTLPNATGTLATLASTSQTFLGTTAFAPTTASSTLTFGSTSGTGAITLGRSTAAQTVDIAVGATAAASTKTINIGTTGVSTSITNITYGSSVTGALNTHIWNAGANSMRFDSNGAVGINGAATAGTSFQLAKNITGSTVAWNLYNVGTIQSDVTNQAKIYVTNPSTAAASFVLSTLTHYFAQQGTIGAGSSITNQYGFEANNTLTGATNNYGFYSNIASGANRYNFYASGTATNFFAGNAIISVTDNTNAALRITQLGTGNALLVEDTTNPDSTPFVVDASGKVAIGATTATENLNLVSDGRNFFQITRASTDTAESVISFRKARGTNAAPTIIASGDAMGTFQYYGYDGTGYVQAASIFGVIDGTPGVSDMPGRLVFNTTPDGSTTPSERMRIDSAGNVIVSTGAVVVYAPAPAAISAAATLTNANIQAQIISATGTTYTITMPLGTGLETLIAWPVSNLGYDFTVINTATGIITMAVNTGVTSLGSLIIAAATSAQFRIRRTAANTFILYRLS